MKKLAYLKYIFSQPKRIFIAFVCFSQISCKKLIEVDSPPTSINSGNVFESDATAISALTGIYGTLSSEPLNSGGTSSISFLSSLSADELVLSDAVQNESLVQYFTNSPSSNIAIAPWAKIYPIIFLANSAIEGLDNSRNLTPSIKTQLLGEAKFVRAFSYFNLVNMYGEVPLVTSTDYEVNSSLYRSPVADVYQQILKDLTESKSLLSSTFQDATLLQISNERIRPTKWAAAALLARVYLYMSDWVNAEQQSSEIINDNLFTLTPLAETFLINSVEAIWQLQPVTEGRNTPDAWLFIVPPTGPDADHPAYLNSNLLDAFEVYDQRKSNWTNSVTIGTDTINYPFKYKSATYSAPITEYIMVLRLAEQYLIRAEARAQLNKISEAQADINAIRTRAGLTPTPASTKDQLLSAIIQERKVELFSEWGHRWFDLKRWGIIDNVMSNITPTKGGTWENTDQLYPIPLSDILRDPNLTQNAGYN